MATQATTTTQPVLQQLVPYVVSASFTLASGISTIARSFVSLFSKTARSILVFSPLPLVFYVLAPAFVFFGIAAEVFVFWPSRIVLALLHEFYPIYVFCGVACITGAVVGLSGRALSAILVRMVHDDYLERRRLVKSGKKARVKAEE